jgi:hypothetical protein
VILPLTALHRSDTNGAIESRPTHHGFTRSKVNERTNCKRHGQRQTSSSPVFRLRLVSLLNHPKTGAALRTAEIRVPPIKKGAHAHDVTFLTTVTGL